MTCPHTDRRQEPGGLIRCEQCGAALGRMVHAKDGQRYTVPVLDETETSEVVRVREVG